MFADLSQNMVGTEKQFAIVLDGMVISAPTFDGVITNGDAQISGNSPRPRPRAWPRASSTAPCRSPSKDGISVEQIGASLAGDQLTAGITAGLLGLLLVMLYRLLYYRGLGLVVIASLIVAAAVTYAMVLLLGHTPASRPGPARHRRPDRRGGHHRRLVHRLLRGASATRCATGSRCASRCRRAGSARGTPAWLPTPVSLLAAVVLYIFAAGVVKGFAFALGLSTLIDLAIFFWFHPPDGDPPGPVLVLQQRPQGLSGLSAETLGADRVATKLGVEPDGQKFSRMGNDL